MKKSWVPLLVIALCVAIVATLVFYGLVVSRLSGVEAKDVHPTSPALETPGVPSFPVGLRAVSIQVGNSDGLIQFLKPGSRIDVQAVYGSPDKLELRTIVQDVEVLATSAAGDRPPGQGKVSILTLAMSPAEADLVGLADTAARLRVILRNADDPNRHSRPAIGLSAIMKPDSPPAPVEHASVPLRHTPPVAAQVGNQPCNACIRP